MRVAIALCLLAITPARAEPVAVHYAAYARGLNVLVLDAEFDLQPRTYRVRLRGNTTGTVGAVFPSASTTTVDGHFTERGPMPDRFFTSGTTRGKPRVTQIDYRGGQPIVRQMVPPNDDEREPIAETAQANTVDALSAMAELLRQVNMAGRCDSRRVLFDGRRLSELEARTIGSETLPPTSRSTFSGPALRCDFEGRQTGGFMLDTDRTALQRPQKGSAWFASVVPGGPVVPVRIMFTSRFLGEANLYLTRE